MRFSIVRNDKDPYRDQCVNQLVGVFLKNGHELSESVKDANFILNLTSTSRPRAGRRCAQSVFIISVATLKGQPSDLRALGYNTLVRTLSNLLVLLSPPNGHPAEAYFTTPEAGFYHLPFEADRVYERILPIAGAHYAIENRFSTDLPARLWAGSPVVKEIARYGKVLDQLGVLPTPFPLRQVLTQEELRHLYKIYGITGLSYGNLSAREEIPELEGTTFWMTGRGVDKSNISRVGKDVLLVKGFDEDRGEALISVPADVDPSARVSVDAVEHEYIYRSFPDVGVIVHVHAWMEGILCTRQNHPCGTTELAREVAELLSRSGAPSRACVGLKNHGITITGPSLEDIFDRMNGRLLTQVPMYA
jgi:ribulose-5-phosphate 4-epimerase/fuculose-1-phosphate aldolase